MILYRSQILAFLYMSYMGQNFGHFIICVANIDFLTWCKYVFIAIFIAAINN